MADKRNIIRNTTVDLILGEIKDNFAKKADLPTKVSDLTNDSGFQTATQVESAINAKIAAVYKPAGSVAFASLPALTADNLGNVYNITDNFETTADFLEGAGKKYKAGADVGIVGVKDGENTVYKYNVFANFVDLTGYIQKISSPVAGNLVKQTADGSLEDTGIKASDVLTQHQDITGKADKDTDAVEGNFAAFDGNGNPVDSGHKHSDYLTAHQDISGKADKPTAATADNLAAFDANKNPVDSGIAKGNVQVKTVPAAAGNLAGLDATGALTDSGVAGSKVLTEDDIKDYTKAEIDALLGITTGE